jgi:spore coat protein A
MRLSRRGFLGALGGSALAAASFGPLLWPRPNQTAELLRSRVPLPKPFTVPLPIPPVAKPASSDASGDVYRITQREVDQEILPGLRTRILSYDGSFPGPTIISKRGRRTVVTHRNELSVPTVVHLHGGHTPADSDGFPMDLVAPQGERSYTYPCEQRAATLWYHDHRMDFTGPQVYRGLAGFHVVHDDEEDALPLPKGPRDIPLMIVDRAFDVDGSLRYPSLPNGPGVEDDYMEGVTGDVVLVNGAPWPVLEVEAARYRFRILNAANARRFGLRLDPGTPMIQIGSDGGLLEKPVSHNELVIAPAERFDVIVDFSAYQPGTELTLHNGLGSGSTSDVMRFRVTRRASDDSRVPDRLSEIEWLDPKKAVRTREWRFRRENLNNKSEWLINGAPFDHHSVSATPRLGDIEIWRFSTDLHHPIHVHLDPFQVVKRHGNGPGSYDSGWKDTVDIGPTDYVDVAIRFTDYAGRYLLHCHNLEHEDMAMMTAFETQ